MVAALVIATFQNPGSTLFGTDGIFHRYRFSFMMTIKKTDNHPKA
jgi:hypothetical protein